MSRPGLEDASAFPSGPDESLTPPLEDARRRFLDRTRSEWMKRRRDLLPLMQSLGNSLGLPSEDGAPVTGESQGDFPQIHSATKPIGGALRPSKLWEDVF